MLLLLLRCPTFFFFSCDFKLREFFCCFQRSVSFRSTSRQVLSFLPFTTIPGLFTEIGMFQSIEGSLFSMLLLSCASMLERLQIAQRRYSMLLAWCAFVHVREAINFCDCVTLSIVMLKSITEMNWHFLLFAYKIVLFACSYLE